MRTNWNFTWCMYQRVTNREELIRAAVFSQACTHILFIPVFTPQKIKRDLTM